MVIEADSELTLSAGGSFIRITPAGVTVVGPTIRQNAGGSPGQGSGLKILGPLVGSRAQSAAAGQMLQSLPNSISAEALLKQRRAFMLATSGLCEVCEPVADRAEAET